MSHRTRVQEPQAMLPATTYSQPSQVTKTSRPLNDKTSRASQRLSMTSNSSAGRRSSASYEGSVASNTARPSGIPRPSRTASSTRPNTSLSSKPNVAQPYRVKAPSNITGVANRTNMRNRSTDRIVPIDSTPRIVTDEDLLSLEPTLPPLDMDHDTVFGIVMPQKQLPQPSNLPPRLIPELQALAAASYRRPTPAMSTISTISSPSTQFTTSPSPWSTSTPATTPISWSSASPALVQTSRVQPASKRSHTVPIPTTVRTKMPKLPVLRETAASSASTSNVNIPSEEAHTPKKLKKKTPMNSPAPTPPPRTSSVKQTRSRSSSKSEDQPPPISHMVPPLPREQDISPILRVANVPTSRPKLPSQAHDLSDNHLKLQEAINFIPSRPSRDGAEGLNVRKPQPVNVSQANYNEQVRKLLDAAPIEALPQSTSQLNLQSSRAHEPEPPVPPLPSRSRLAKFSKLALFGRSPKKTSADADAIQQPQKLQQRGPSAGTGHEGYARFGRRERKTSTDGHNTGTDSESSVASAKRKPMRSASKKDSSNSSQRNRASQSDLDDFAASRLKPVVILGGSQKPNREWEAGPAQRSALSHNEETKPLPTAEERSRQPSVVSSGPLLRESRLIFHLDSLDAHDPSGLALRRSQRFENPEKFPMPAPINTGTFLNRPYPSSYNTSQSSIGATSAALTDNSNDLYKVDSRLLEKQRKKSRKLNWGFFKRKETVPESYKPRTSSRGAAPLMPVRVSVVPPSRPMPYYAMLESENEISNTEAIGDFLTEAARAIPNEEDDVISPIDQPAPASKERRHSVLLPTAPKRIYGDKQQQPPKRTQDQPSAQPAMLSLAQLTPKPRQPRLAQVGRIPKVVPTTQANVIAQPQSARLFQQEMASSSQTLILDKPARAEPLLPAARNNMSPKPSLRNVSADKFNSGPSRTQIEPRNTAKHHRFNEVSKIVDRYSTTSSSSDGVLSVMGPPLLPAPEFPTRSVRYTTTEDDVWNEYDEFIDRVISPPRLKKSRTRITDDDRVQPCLPSRYEAPTDTKLSVRRTLKDLAINTSLAPPPLLFASRDLTEDRETNQDFHLRRSRIISALHSSLDPSSPYSINDYLAELGEPRRASGRTSGRLSDSQISQGSLRSPLAATTFPEPPTMQTEYRHYDNTAHMDELERSKDPARHSERSYASLMVSRWLSFGRVLFSPAHTDLQRHTERHVLVIDGLGSEDWSIYCAVTYQTEQAYIYDLKETGHTRSSTSSNKAGNVPPNFRRREIASFTEVFKFPDNFFSVIVLRFPPVMAESKLKNIISQCRRVLAPGGYLELVLLDLDIVNMGVSTRRAMRELKTKIAMRNREVSLKPMIDNVQSVLGEKGFSKLSKCVVGVPVVGKPVGAESPTSSRSSGASDRHRQYPSAGPRPPDGLQGQYHHNFSLNDLVADHSDNADAKIGRVVSRTARSWWQHCFEAAVISDGDLTKSILSDKQVLSECKARASSFKLLIAYTQKPGNASLGGKRRTMSEPVIATLATAGTP